MSDLGGLFESCPALRRSEERARNNLDDRKWILDLIPKESVGAELGVFTGLLSEAILEIVRPRRLFLVDVCGLDMANFTRTGARIRTLAASRPGWPMKPLYFGQTHRRAK